jgi:hypothetical protein
VLLTYLIYYIVNNALFVIELDTVLPIYRTAEHGVPCGVNLYLQDIADDVTSIGLIGLATERFIAVYFPMRARQLLTFRKRACGITGGFILYLVLTYPTIVLMSPVPNPYAIHGISCSGGSVSSLMQVVCTPMILVLTYVVPPLISLLLSTLIVIKIAHATSKRSSIITDRGGVEADRGLLESCITLVLMSLVHVTLYLPYGVQRTVTVALASYFRLAQSDRFINMGVSNILYVMTLPVHFANFIIYFRRVPGFAKNVAALWRCRRLTAV